MARVRFDLAVKMARIFIRLAETCEGQAKVNALSAARNEMKRAQRIKEGSL